MFTQEIPYILTFYIWSMTISFVGFGLSSYFFKKSSDLGYGVSRIFGMLIISYLVWLGTSVVKIPYSIYFILSLIMIGVAASMFFLRKQKVTWHSIKRNFPIILMEEFIFILAYAAMIAYRGANPRIEGIEKFMDYAILNGLYRSESLPPLDVWFSGYLINYYYFGHFILNLLNKLTQIPREISYNLQVGNIFALSVTGAFSVIINLITAGKKISHLKFFTTGIFAFLGSMILTVGGNLDYMYQVLYENKTDYFYADARSLISYTINEFPAYSFLISDLHAHILDIPFVLLFLFFSIYIWNNYENKLDNKIIIFYGLSLGSLSAINSWDFFVYSALVGLLFLVIVVKHKFARPILTDSIINVLKIFLVSLLLFVPFYLNFHPASGGVGLTKEFLPLLANIKMFGYFMAIFIGLLFYLLFTNERTKQDYFVLILFSFGFLLAISPNFIFLKDIYFKLNPPYYLANTVFKLWYQAWIILSISSGYTIYKLVSIARLKPIVLPILIFITFLTIYVFKYPVVSLKYILGSQYKYLTLDGSAYLETNYKDEMETIYWLNSHIKNQPVLLEAVGKPYSMDSLVSSYTGLPTPVGWNEHELGWRDNWPEISNRMGDVEKIYTIEDVDEVMNLLAKYNVNYVLVSNNEREKYGDQAGMTFDNFMNLVYENHSVKVYLFGGKPNQ